MSVIQKIREKYAGVVIAFIAISLIAFILMDAFSGGGGGLFGNPTSVGKVNGKSIEKKDFDRQVEIFKTSYNMANTPTEQIYGRVWDMTVDKMVMEDEYEKLGIVVSDKELNSILFGENPPYWLKQNFTDQQTGVYNAQQAADYFRELKKRKNDPRVDEFYEVYMDQQTIQQTMRSKYLSLLTNSTYVPKWLAEKQMADQAGIASISYVYVPYASLNDSAYKVSDDEVKNYVNKHKAQFQAEEETRTIAYVAFDIKPNALDSSNVYSQVMGYRNELATTTDENAFLTRVGTELPYYDSYMGGSKIQHAFKDSITNMPVGSVYGPYIDGSNIVLAKMVGVKNWPDSARVRHILIKTGDPRTGQMIRDDSTAKKRIDSIELALKAGANFDSLVVKLSEDEGSNTPDKKGVYDYFGQGQMVKAFNDFAFDKSVGSKGVVKTEFGYHYVEVLGQKNFQPAYKIAYLAKPILASEETRGAAEAEAQKFAAASRNQKQYNENVDKFKKQSLSSLDVKKNDFSVQGVGESRTLVRWMYESDLGDVSEPMDMKDKFIVAMLTNIQEEGLMNVTKARPIAEPLIRNEKKAKQIISEKFKGNTLESYAQSAGTAIGRADSLMYVSSFIPGVGMEPKITGVAFNRGQLNKVSQAIAGANGVFGVRSEMIGARPTTGALEDVRKTLETQLKSGGGFNTVGSLRKAANIKDNRFTFF